ncbi:MAG: beta-propeller domain-containing protein, partial [Oscillospiraceae bacterium]
EINGSFRIATTTTDSKTSKHYTSIFVLDKALKPIKSISNLCSDKTVQAVKFSEKSAYIDIANENENITILIPDEGNPKQAEASDANVQTAFLHKFGDKFVGLDVLTTEKGKNDGLKLTIYDGALKEIASEKLEGNISTTLSCENIGRNAFLFDEEKNVIAIPTVSDGAYGVKNLYYVFTIGGEKGLTKNGVLEYNSISDKLVFNRAMISGDIFYAFSGTKVFSAQLSDLKVIDTVDLK